MKQEVLEIIARHTEYDTIDLNNPMVDQYHTGCDVSDLKAMVEEAYNLGLAYEHKNL